MVCPLVWTTKEAVLRLLIIEHENVPTPILRSLRLSEGSKNGGWKKGDKRGWECCVCMSTVVCPSPFCIITVKFFLSSLHGAKQRDGCDHHPPCSIFDSPHNMMSVESKSRNIKKAQETNEIQTSIRSKKN